MNKLTTLFMMMLFAGLGACNTTAGFGEDVEATGEGIQHAAEEVEEELEGEG